MRISAWFSKYAKILSAAAYEHKAGRLTAFLDRLRQTPLPKPNEHMQIQCPPPSNVSLRLRRPNDTQRPLIGVRAMRRGRGVRKGEGGGTHVRVVD